MSIANKTHGDTNPQTIDVSAILTANNKTDGDVVSMQFVLKAYPGQKDENASFNKSGDLTISNGIVSVPFVVADYSSIVEGNTYFVGFAMQFNGDESLTAYPIDCLSAINFNQKKVG